jgi:hypothetical protein
MLFQNLLAFAVAAAWVANADAPDDNGPILDPCDAFDAIVSSTACPECSALSIGIGIVAQNAALAALDTVSRLYLLPTAI